MNTLKKSPYILAVLFLSAVFITQPALGGSESDDQQATKVESELTLREWCLIEATKSMQWLKEATVEQLETEQVEEHRTMILYTLTTWTDSGEEFGMDWKVYNESKKPLLRRRAEDAAKYIRSIDLPNGSNKSRDAVWHIAEAESLGLLEAAGITREEFRRWIKASPLHSAALKKQILKD